MTSVPASPDARSPAAAPLTPVTDALSALIGACGPVEPEEVPVAEAVGAILAEPIRAPGPLPRCALALRPGWAVDAAALLGASPYAPTPLGDAPTFVQAGDALPPGTDAVLPPDAVAIEAGFAQALAETVPGAFVRRPGEDAGEGAVLRAAGEVLRPRHVALARLAGVELCRVRRPRLRFLHTGSETAEAVASLLAVVTRSAGAEAELVAERLGYTERPGRADAFLILDESEGALPFDRLVARGVALRPGESITCGIVEDVPAIAAPARAADALAAELVLLRPVLAHLAAAAGGRPRRLPLTRKIASTVGLTEVALLRETADGFEPLGAGDLTLLALALADSWLAVPPESEGFAAGDRVEAWPL